MWRVEGFQCFYFVLLDPPGIFRIHSLYYCSKNRNIAKSLKLPPFAEASFHLRRPASLPVQRMGVVMSTRSHGEEELPVLILPRSRHG